MDQPAMCSFVSPSSASLASMSTEPSSSSNEAVRSSVLVLMFETPGIAARSLRTEAAQPPHVMPGNLSEINLVLDETSVSLVA